MPFINPNAPQSDVDLSTFNYGTQADKLKRQRELASQLMMSKQPTGQMVPGGPNGFYVKPSLLANLAPVLQQLMGKYMDNKSNSDADSLDKNSQAAFAKQYGGLGDSVRDPIQDSKEAAAEMLRESRRGSGVEAGEMSGQATSDAFDRRNDAPVAESVPVPPQSPDNSVPLPVTSISPDAKRAAVAKLGAQTGSASGSWGPPEAQEGPGAALRNIAAQRLAVQAEQGAAGGGRGFVNPPLVGPAQGPVQGPPALPQAPQAAALPPMGAPPQQAAPPQVPQAPQPPQNPFTGTTTAPGTAQLQDGTVAQVSNPDPYSRAPNQQELVSRLVALGKTGPEGHAIAQAQLNSLFASKNGRFSATVHADPVNGGFVQVTTDSQTGSSKVAPIGASGGEKVLETKDTPNGIFERTSKGWRPAMVGDKPLMGKEAQDKSDKAAVIGKEADSAVALGDDLKKSLLTLTGIDPATGKPLIDATAGIGGRLSLLYNTITRDPTNASKAQSEVEGLKSKIFNFGMAKIRTAGGGAGAANSDAEGKRLEMALGNLDIAKLGTDGFVAKTNDIIREIEENAARIDAQASAAGATLTRRQPGAAPSPMSYSAFTGGR